MNWAQQTNGNEFNACEALTSLIKNGVTLKMELGQKNGEKKRRQKKKKKITTQRWNF